MNIKQKKISLNKFLKKKIGSKKFDAILPNENLLASNTIDSFDLVEIHTFFENELNIKINHKKLLVNNMLTLNNIYKCL